LDTWNYATSTELWIIWYKEGIEEALFAHRLDIFSLNLDLMLHLLWRTESRGAGEGS